MNFFIVLPFLTPSLFIVKAEQIKQVEIVEQIEQISKVEQTAQLALIAKAEKEALADQIAKEKQQDIADKIAKEKQEALSDQIAKEKLKALSDQIEKEKQQALADQIEKAKQQALSEKIAKQKLVAVENQNTKEELELAGPQGTEIVLATIKVKKGQVTLTNAQNITSRTGYDSQPVFMEKDKALYFTRHINKQTDIYRMNLKTRVAKPYMQTPESEYSATPIAGRDGLSVVRVDMDKSQSVYWLHKKNKKNNVGLMSDIDNIGYHNWSGKNKLWMFVINGEIGNLFYQATGQKPKQIASNIGRAIKSDAKYKNIYYVDKSQDDWWIKKIDTKKFKQTKVIALPKGVEDFAIDAKGNYWCGKGNTLYYSQKGKNWMIVKEFSIPGLSNITRIDINSKMTQIAITFDET